MQCYIQYMKFCRRTEGTTAARSIFKRAREDKRTTHHAYVAAALMEYYCTKDKKIAANVFELGFKKFKHDEKFVLAYIDYLSHLNGEQAKKKNGNFFGVCAVLNLSPPQKKKKIGRCFHCLFFFLRGF